MASCDEVHKSDSLGSEGEDWSLTERPVSPEKRELLERPTLPRPTRIGRYNNVKYLGHGGMGIVFEAKHPVSQQQVALKVIIPQRATPRVIEDFLQEIRLLARFSHRGIARILDADTCELDGKPSPYFTMELIEGAKHVTDYARDARCDCRRRLELVLQMVSAVAHAHRVKVIHGDIKPSNVLVGLDGEVKVVDFGAALDASAEVTKLRALSVDYAAPEQLSELRATLQSDVYSLGVLACEILTGRRPFDEPPKKPIPGGTHAGPYVRNPIPVRKLNPDIRWQIEPVLEHALSPQPEDRYPDAGAFQSDFETAMRGGLPKAADQTYWSRTRAFCAEHRGPVTAVSVTFAALMLGIAGTSWQSIKAHRKESETRHAKDEAEHSAARESQARKLSEEMKQSATRAIDFVRKLLFSVDTYKAQDQTLDIDYMLKSADEQLPTLEQDKRAAAIALGVLGRVAANWGRFEKGTNWLSRSARLWKDFVEDSRYGPDEQAAAKRERAAVLNSLAWAELGNPRQEIGRKERAKRAATAAQAAFEIRKELDGPGIDDTLCFQADWLRMRWFASDQFQRPVVAMDFVNLLAVAAGQQSTNFVASLRETLAATANLASEGKVSEAKQRATKFLAPFIDKARPRFRARMPWSLAQATEEISRWSRLTGLSDQRIAVLRITLADVAVALAAEIHPADRVTIENVRKARDRIVSDTETK